MTHAVSITSLVVGVLAALSNAAHATQPPDVVSSDSLGNTAMGSGALFNSMPAGNKNTASGEGALYQNTTGSYNTALGGEALWWNSAGNSNTAMGFQSLNKNTTGGNNTAAGESALYQNTTGSQNTALGGEALWWNSTGYFNTATGFQSLNKSTTGWNNTAIGAGALSGNVSGNSNVGLGFRAGDNQTTGSNNVYIANEGAPGENGTIRVGSSGPHTATFIAGISGTAITGAAVYVTAAGQLGVLASSERFKSDIQPMGAVSDRLARLRPVSFHLKTEPNGAIQYGLIAEEVSKVYPELVIHDDKGQIQGVRYDELSSMLLNEAQQLRKQVSEQGALIRTQAVQLSEVQQQLADLKSLKQALLGAIREIESRDLQASAR
jgi:trimeric autotransporter adhesin